MGDGICFISKYELNTLCESTSMKLVGFEHFALVFANYQFSSPSRTAARRPWCRSLHLQRGTKFFLYTGGEEVSDMHKVCT